MVPKFVWPPLYDLAGSATAHFAPSFDSGALASFHRSICYRDETWIPPADDIHSWKNGEMDITGAASIILCLRNNPFE